MSGQGTVRGDDGRDRCPWGDRPSDYRDYHDSEWGRPVTSTDGLFERITLEAFQSGLSWLTILRKRPAFRAAFGGFAPATVAAYGGGDVARLLADRGIVRNRAKIEATLSNARAVLALDVPLADLMWEHAPDPAGHPAPVTSADVPAVTAESTALAAELKRRGFRFVGPTTAYALMQAVGMVDGHLAGCFARGAVALRRRRGSP
ncbi:MAG: DNA-3-methyladenine glycosylase I [Pseudonocardiales bacterium]|nr:DNA-3-methyladenine glycosylase I [Pseudonocardiales bacterium]